MKRQLRCIAALLLLSSCTFGGRPGMHVVEEQEFDSSNPYGLAIVGVASNHPGGTGWELFDRPPTSFGIKFVQIDVDSNRVVDGGGSMNAWRTLCQPFMVYPNGCNDDFQVVVYYPFVIPPGEYMLATINAMDRPGTSFLSEQSSHFSSIAASIEDGRLPWFSIEPGEILYLGDIIVDVRDVPAKIVEIRQSPEGARRMLSKYPNVTGTVSDGALHAPNLPGGTE